MFQQKPIFSHSQIKTSSSTDTGKSSQGNMSDICKLLQAANNMTPKEKEAEADYHTALFGKVTLKDWVY